MFRSAGNNPIAPRAFLGRLRLAAARMASASTRKPKRESFKVTVPAPRQTVPEPRHVAVDEPPGRWPVPAAQMPALA